MTKKAVSKSASCCWEVSWWHLHDNIAHDVVDVLPDQVLRWQLHEIVAHVVDVLPDQVLWWQLHESVAHVVDLGVGGHLGSSSKGPAGAAHTLHMQKYWYIVNCPIYTESQTTHNTGLNY